jgi:hypothetical protein
MTLQADESLGTDSSEQLPDDDLNADTDTNEAENDPADDGEVEVTFGEPSDDEAQESEDDGDEDASSVIRNMRKREREKDRKLRQAERELEQLRKAQQPQTAAPELPPKPTLESCNWDEQEFEQKFVDWQKTASEVEKTKAQQQEQQQALIREAEAKRTAYQENAKKLKAKDFADAEEEVVSIFDQTRQSILLEASDNPALLVYALGKNPAQLERLSKITSLAKFAAELGKLEKDLKVSKPTKPAPADTNLRSNAPTSGSSKKLAQLEAEAERTGDRTKLIAYKRSLRK